MANDSDRSGPREHEHDRGASRVTTLEPPQPVAAPVPSTAPAPVRRLNKKERKLRKDQRRPLSSWERYRALTDVVEESLDLVDLADHKARFALVIMGALNALLFVMASQTDTFDAIPITARPVMTAFIVVYALVALYFVVQAIESLRPRKAQPRVSYLEAHGPEDHPVGLRFYEDIVVRSVEDYRTAWRDLRIGQLNAELAVQGHALAQINKAKYGAVRRLYLGLQIMTLMAVVLMAIGSYFVLSGKARRLDAKARERAGLSGLLGGAADGDLPEPTRLTDIGVREPSGVAADPRTGHVFLVGDDGSLAELDGAGKRLRAGPVKGNLEDVTVHTPSGNLVLLAEGSSELILYDAASSREVRRLKLDHDAVLGQPRGDRTQGFEGIAFREDPARPGGGVFYLTHQHAPALLLALAFDPAKATTVGGDTVLGRWPLGSHGDLTAVTWVPALERLLVIAEKDDQLLVVGTDGTLERELTLPGDQQEGIALDAQGTLWVADDKDKSLLRFENALEALQGRKPDGRGTGLRIPG
jgi:uncharacterized protein YjiK